MELISQRMHDQKNVSKFNIQELRALAALEGPENARVARLAAVAVKIAIKYPGRKKRWQKLRRSHPELCREYFQLLFGPDYRDAMNEEMPDFEDEPPEVIWDENWDEYRALFPDREDPFQPAPPMEDYPF